MGVNQLRPMSRFMYELQAETVQQARQLTASTVEAQSHNRGLARGEPLLVMMDALLRYAKAYRARNGEPLASEHVLGAAWLSAVKGVRALLDGDGAIALEQGWSTDSKSNGVCEGVFWEAIRTAGFEDEVK